MNREAIIRGVSGAVAVIGVVILAAASRQPISPELTQQCIGVGVPLFVAALIALNRLGKH